jgi:RNA polymerase sigma factor (sigma-70 family)
VTSLPGPDDAALALAAGRGENAALAAIYDRYGGRLLGFCRSMLRNQSDAEDCLQDVFVIAATRLTQLREPALLRSWLFAVARHECLGRIDTRTREVLMDEIPDLLRDAVAGLAERDRLLLELADRQGLSGEELALAVGVPRSTAYTLLARARASAGQSIGALLVARSGRDDCSTLDALLADWDGRLTTLRRKQLNRHIDRCEVCGERRHRLATPAALLGEASSFAATPVGLRTRVLRAAAGAGAAAPAAGSRSPSTAANGARASSVDWVAGWPPPDRVLAHRRRRRHVALIIMVLALLLGAGVSVGAVFNTVGQSTNGAPAPAPISAPPTPTPTATTAPAPGTPSPTTGRTATTQSTTVAPPPPTRASTTTPRAALSPTPTTSTAQPPSPPSARVTRVPPHDTLALTTAARQASVDYGKATDTCSAQTTCTYVIAQGTEVTVSAPGRPPDHFSAPPGCTSGYNTCSFVMTGDLTIVLTALF